MAAVILGTVLLLVVLFAPLFLFLIYGWKSRRRQIVDLFPDSAVTLYYKTYFPATQPRASNRPDFITDFDQRYGRQHFLVPTLVLFAVTLFLLVLCLNTVAEAITEPLYLANFQVPFVVVACAAGAYMWVTYDFVVRERSLDFSTTHVNRAAFRLTIAAPLAYAIPLLFPQYIGIPAAILLGSFPTDTLMWILRRRSRQLLGLTETPDDEAARLENLASVDSATADRIRLDGITSIAELANTDPIALTIRTGLCFSFILDCMSEALAWHYLGKLGTVVGHACSLPGALEVCGLIAELDYDDDKANPCNDRCMADKGLAAQTMVVMAEKLGMNAAVLERTLRTIVLDSRVDFLSKLMDALAAVR